MAFFTFGNTVDMGTFRNQFQGGTGPISIESIRTSIHPNSISFRSLSSFRNTGIWRYRVITNNATFGRFQVVAPVDSGIVADFTTPWFRSADFPNIAFTSVPAYGRFLLRWEFENGQFITSGGGTTGTAWNTSNQLIIRAVFA